MYRSIFTCSILFTLVVTTCSKSIRIGNNEDNEDIENTSTDSVSATLSVHPIIQEKSESDSKLGTTRSLLILVPTTEEKEDIECKSQKTKRCKTLFRRERVSSPISKDNFQTILKSKNPGNVRNNEKHAESSLDREPNIELVSLKNPVRKPMSASQAIERAKNATFRDEALINSLRKQLTPKDPNVGAARKSSIPKTSVIEDDNFVCYCREKNNPVPKKDTNRNIVSKSQPLATKSKTEKKPDNKKILVSSKQHPKPARVNVPHRPPLSNKLPATYPDTDIYHYPPNYLHNIVYPTLAQKGHGTIPYIPYVYHVDPHLSMATNTDDKEIPTKINIPFNSIGSKPDSIVGQRAPIDQQHNINNNQQIVGQASCPPNMVGESLTQSSRKTISTTTSKMLVEENTLSNDDKESRVSDYNLQSVHSDSSDKNHLTPSGTIESSSEARNLKNANTNEYETTDSGTMDYSDIKEVTTAYFTSKAYTNETGHDGSASYDDFYMNSTGPMNTDTEEDQNYVNLQSRLNNSTEDSMEPEQVGMNTETKRLNNAKDSDQANEDEKNIVLGKSNPHWNKEKSVNDDSNQNVGSNVESTQENVNGYELKEPSFVEETTALIFEDSTSSDEIGISAEIDDKNTPLNERLSAEDYATESPETEDNVGPLENDYEKENSESNKPEQKIDDEECDERSPVTDSLTDETVHSVNSKNDYTTIYTTIEDFVNTDNERVGAQHVTTIRNENENDPPSVGATLKSFGMDDAKNIKDVSNQTLPFCDNVLLEKSIKTVINNFATDDSSEMNGDINEETVGSSKDEDLLPEIVQVPNLKGILSMPPIEHTIVNKVKNLLSKMTGITRMNFDNDWATNVIKNNLRNAMSAAPSSKTELPPMVVQERQFKNGKWVTNVVTLEPPPGEEAHVPTDLEKLQASVKSLLRDPAVSFQAAKNPAVQNMIVQSVRHTFKPENATSGEAFDNSVIKSTLNNELSIMEMENEEITTTENVFESTTFDVSNIDMNKLLDIAKSEAGLEDSDSESSTLSKLNPKETATSTMESSKNGLVGATRDSESSEYFKESTIYPVMETNRVTVQLSEENETPKIMKEIEPHKLEATTSSMEELAQVPKYNSVSSRNQDESSTTETEEYADSRGNADAIDGDEAESAERLVGMKNTRSTTELYSDDTSVHDLAYLGKITVKNEHKADNIQSLQNSELFYIGDDVKLPLEIRKLKDGSYGLSISKKVCEHLLNKECPCCVPVKGNVVRTVKRNSKAKNADKTIRTSKRRRISKRESTKSIPSNERRKCDSADDSIQIFSMPVETFARRYNLSLNLEKVQTPWNFDAKEKIDEPSKDRQTNFKNKEKINADIDFHNLLSVYTSSENSKPKITIAKEEGINNNLYEKNDATSHKKSNERYRYQRNINENVNKRVEIVKSMLNWLKDMILSTTIRR